MGPRSATVEPSVILCCLYTMSTVLTTSRMWFSFQSSGQKHYSPFISLSFVSFLPSATKLRRLYFHTGASALGGICSGGCLLGGVCSGGVCSGGVCLGGCLLPGGLVQEGVCSRGVWSGEVSAPGGWGLVSQYALRQTPQ